MTAYPNINRFQENKKFRRFAFSSFIILNTRAPAIGLLFLLQRRLSE